MGKVIDKVKATIWTESMKADVTGNRAGVLVEIFGFEYDPDRRIKLLEELQKKHADMLKWEAERAAARAIA